MSFLVLHWRTGNRGLKSTGIHLPSLPPLVLENRRLGSWCPPRLFQLLGLRASVPGLVAASLPSLPPSPRGFSSVSVSLLCLIKDPVTGFRTAFIQKTSFQNPLLHSICKNLFLQNKVTLKSSGLRTWTYHVGVTIESTGRKAMPNLDSVFKSRDITLPTKVYLVKAVVFPVVMYGSEGWTIMKAERRLMDAFELQCWRRLLRVPWTARRSNHSILKEISLEFSLGALMLKLKLQYFGHLMRRLWCWERLKAGGEGDDRGWDGWMASRIRWTWVWASSGRWWWAGRPGMLQSRGRTRLSDWADWNRCSFHTSYLPGSQWSKRGFCVFKGWRGSSN